MNRALFVIFALVTSALGLAPTAFADQILDRLEALPGVDAIEKTTEADTEQGLRRFELQIEQPTDHFDPSAGTFRQKLVLFHRDFSEPMVLQTSGYIIFTERLSRLASVFETNQIQVEHRFFAGSSPNPKDWSKLTVRQSAEDFHRIVSTLKQVYSARWVGTGASKGGMTSVFHRRFYPNDLDGTVADVAPISYSLTDTRYVDFVDRVGGARYAACRASLEAVQLTLLERRQEVLPSMTGEFNVIGGKGVAFEYATIEMPFVFWQYGNPEDPNTGCAHIPNQLASTEELTDFITTVNDPSGMSDTEIAPFVSYYYQSLAELGGPASKLDHLQSLLQFPYTLDQFQPDGMHVAYSNTTMHDVQRWVTEAGQGIMFVYGEFDPWTAGAFRDVNNAAGADNHFFVQAGGNHGSNFTGLTGADRAASLRVLSRWLNKAPSNKSLRAVRGQESLEDFELKALRKLKL